MKINKVTKKHFMNIIWNTIKSSHL